MLSSRSPRSSLVRGVGLALIGCGACRELVFEERGDGATASPTESLGERVKRDPLGTRQRDGERAPTSLPWNELSRWSRLFFEELVAVVLVGDHDQVGEAVSLVGEVADSLGKLEGKRQPDLGQWLPASGCGGDRTQRVRRGRGRRRHRLGARRRFDPAGVNWSWGCAARRGTVRFVGRWCVGAEAKAGELGLAEASHAQPAGLASARVWMRVRISSASAW